MWSPCPPSALTFAPGVRCLSAGAEKPDLFTRYYRDSLPIGTIRLTVLDPVTTRPGGPDGLGRGRDCRDPGPHVSPEPLVPRRGFDLVECSPSSTDLLDDLVRGLGPDEGLRVLVPVVGPQTQRLGELADAAEDTTAKPALGQQSEPALDQIEPRRTGRSEVQVPAGLGRLSQPLPHLGPTVGREVVEDDVDVER